MDRKILKHHAGDKGIRELTWVNHTNYVEFTFNNQMVFHTCIFKKVSNYELKPTIIHLDIPV